MEQHSKARRKVPERNGDLAINLPIEVGYSNMYIDMWSFSGATWPNQERNSKTGSAKALL